MKKSKATKSLFFNDCMFLTESAITAEVVISEKRMENYKYATIVKTYL